MSEPSSSPSSLPAAAAFDSSQLSSGFAVRRDQKPMVTPGGHEIVVPEKNLAEAICEEWRRQGTKPNFAAMPLFQLVCTAFDKIEPEREGVIKGLMAFADNELLCHRASEPDELKERQVRHWQPVLDWALRRFDAQLKCAEGLMPIRQPPETIAALKAQTETYSQFILAGLRHATEVTGSYLLGLALAEQHLTAQEAFELSELDATFQMEKWGEDPAAKSRRQGIKSELDACERYLKYLRRQA